MKLGIIGGSGLYQMDGLESIGLIEVGTPFGKPSDKIATGEMGGVELAFLPRHGKGHIITPGELNHRANIFALKKIGVTHIVSISAVGSLKKEIRPLDVVIVDQYFDRTKNASGHSFFGDGIVAHVSMAEPVCPELANIAKIAAEKSILETYAKKKDRPLVHAKGTYLNMEGPAFSTKAESQVYRAWGMDVIGMTNLAEAKLAREAEICYTTVAMVTDYDCWHPDHDHVTVEMIIKNFTANVSLAKLLLRKLLPSLPILKRDCKCPSALASAIISSPDCVSKAKKRQMEPIIGKYMPA